MVCSLIQLEQIEEALQTQPLKTPKIQRLNKQIEKLDLKNAEIKYKKHKITCFYSLKAIQGDAAPN